VKSVVSTAVSGLIALMPLIESPRMIRPVWSFDPSALDQRKLARSAVKTATVAASPH
jgi:hypothetical protein